jgi:primase-polymerase (primpol)-like protein
MTYIVYGPDKKPRSPHTGQVCDPHDPANRSDRATAETAVMLGLGEGIGWVFTPADPYFFLDIDHALVDGAWSAVAVELCNLLTGCYVEVSRSGTGLHIIGTGTLPAGHRTRCQEHGLELYTSGRYCALTG